MHWTHEQFYDAMSNVKALFNFCCDYLYHPKTTERERFNQYPTEWGYRNITSRSFTFTDKGSRQKSYTDVSIQK